MSLINDLQWRYAAKKMNNEKIAAEKLDVIMDAINLTASSYGLQPYKILAISNPEIKAKLQAAAYNQEQVSESDVVLVFTVFEKLTSADVEAFVANIVEKRKADPAMLEGYKQMMLGTVNSLTDEQQQMWSAKQAYIALGTALIAAAEQKVDACPMEGFDREKFDEILDLKSKGLKSVVILPLGYRSPEDYLANLAKVRKSKAQLFEIIK
jgi:nitroreductase / dihydropteridine reductase